MSLCLYVSVCLSSSSLMFQKLCRWWWCYRSCRSSSSSSSNATTSDTDATTIDSVQWRCTSAAEVQCELSRIGPTVNLDFNVVVLVLVWLFHPLHPLSVKNVVLLSNFLSCFFSPTSVWTLCSASMKIIFIRLIFLSVSLCVRLHFFVHPLCSFLSILVL